MSAPYPEERISREQAARNALAELFLRNADAGDHDANDELVAELCRRIREQQNNGGQPRRRPRR